MKLNSRVLLAAATLASAVSSAPAALTVAVGDLLAGFYAVEEDLSDPDAPLFVVLPNTYIYNLGPASKFREQTTPQVIANIGADLTTTFGNTWPISGGVRWGIIGTVAQSDPLTLGDPNRTNYYSQSNGGIPKSSSTFSLGSSERGGLANGIKAVSVASDGAITLAGGGARILVSTANDYSEKQPPTMDILDYFGIGQSPNTQLTMGAGGIAGLDIYRIINSISGADLTAAQSIGNAVVGTGQYIGSFQLTGAGELRFLVPTAPPASGYSAWLTANSLSGGNAAPDADPERDGILNGVEFVIGSNPQLAGDQGRLPVVTVGAGGSLNVVFRRTDASAYLNPVIEYDTDLAGTWTPAVNGVGGVTISTEDNFEPVTDRITVNIPGAGVRNFARLRVVVPP